MDTNTRTYLTKIIAGLMRDAERFGAPADCVADLWKLRALPVDRQLRQLPEWLRMRDEWRAA
jgi:hypothetical protein